jgi:hypothetical protein
MELSIACSEIPPLNCPSYERVEVEVAKGSSIRPRLFLRVLSPFALHESDLNVQKLLRTLMSWQAQSRGCNS